MKFLQQTPDVNAIFCCNDEMALGTAEAVNAANKTGEILISGVDGNADSTYAIETILITKENVSEFMNK